MVEEVLDDLGMLQIKVTSYSMDYEYEDETVKVDYLIFTNEYYAISGGGTINEPSLVLQKNVKGFGDSERYFPFVIEIDEVQLMNAPTNYKVYLMDGTGQVLVPAPENGTLTTAIDGEGYTYIIGTYGEELEIKLKDGQQLVFIDLPAGTTLEITEFGSPFYIPSAELYFNAVHTHIENLSGDNLYTGPLMITEGENAIFFENTFDSSIIPTGISLNDLPYIFTIVLAVGALALFVIIKLRKKNRVR